MSVTAPLAVPADPLQREVPAFLGCSSGPWCSTQSRATWDGLLPTGKCHLYKALTHHEEATREASLCKKLRDIQVLQEVLSAAHQRTRLKYTQHQEDDDLLNLTDAPNIVCEWQDQTLRVQRGLLGGGGALLSALCLLILPASLALAFPSPDPHIRAPAPLLPLATLP